MSDDSDKEMKTEDIDLSFGDDFEDDFDEVFSEDQLLVPAEESDAPTSSGIDEKTVLADDDGGSASTGTEEKTVLDDGDSDFFEAAPVQDEKTALVDGEGQLVSEAQPEPTQVSVQDENTQLMDDEGLDVFEADNSGLQSEQTMAVESFQVADEPIKAPASKPEQTIVDSGDSEEVLDLMDSEELGIGDVQDNTSFSDEGSGGQTEMLGQEPDMLDTIDVQDTTSFSDEGSGGQTEMLGQEPEEVLEVQEESPSAPSDDQTQDQADGIDGLFVDMHEDIDPENDSAEYGIQTSDIRAETDLVGEYTEDVPKDAEAVETVAPIGTASAATKNAVERKSTKAAKPEASFIESNKSTSRKNKKNAKRWIWITPLCIFLLVGGYAGYAILLTPQGFMGIGAKDDGAGQQAKQVGEKVQLTPDVLQSLDQKYDQAMQLAKVDRYPSYQKALSLIKEIENIYPNHPKAASAMVELLMMANRSYMTVEQIKKVVEGVRTAERVSPNTPETLRAKVRLLLLQGKKDEGLVRLKQLKNIAADDVATDLLEAEVHLNMGDLTQAKTALDKVLAKEADHIRAHYILAKYFFEKQRWANVVRETKPLVKNQHWASSVLQARALYQEKAYNKVKQQLEELLATQENQLSPMSYGQAYKTLSDIYILQNDKPKALELLEKAVSKVTLNDIYAKQLGDLYFTDKNYTKAAQYYSLARNIKAENIDYAIAYGKVLRLSGKSKEAVEVLKPVITKAPNREDGVIEYAKSRMDLNQFDEVQTYLANVIEANPSFIAALILTGDLHAQKNELDQAEKIYKKALEKSKNKTIKAESGFALGSLYAKTEKWSLAQSYLESSNQLKPNQTQTLFMLGKVYYAQNQISKASIYIQRSLEKDPKNIEAQGILAGIHFKKGDQKKATELIQEVLKKAPKNIELRIMNGKILMAQGKYKEALVEMDEAYMLDAQRYDVYYYMGQVEREIGQTDLSIQSLDRALTILPESSKAYYQRGLTHIRKNQIENAIKDMDKATQYSKKWPEPYQAIARYYFEVALYDQSLQFYEKANKIQKNDRQSDFQMAKAYFLQGESQKALDLLTRMSKQYSNYAPVYHEIGLILEERGDFETAFKYYQRATVKDPKFADSYQRMGFVYKNFDQDSSAIKMFKKYLTLRPDAVDQKDIQEEITRMETQRP